MTLESNPSGFGKRQVHRLWADHLGGDTLSPSPARGVAAAALLAGSGTALAIAGIGAASAALASADLLSRAVLLFAAAAAALVAAAAFWAALRGLRFVLRPGPVIRLDASRIVLRTPTDHIVLAWEDVSLSFGRLFATIRARAASPGGSASRRPEEILIPAFLMRGGSAALQDAVRRFRPDMSQPSSALPGGRSAGSAASGSA